MICVSSFRPFEGCPPAVWENQVTANRSWVRLFPQIFYFNDAEPRMRSAQTVFLPTAGKPSIKNLANFCGALNDWSCIINADIVLTQQFRRMEDQLRSHQAACCVSRRYQLPPDGDTGAASLQPADHGLDFFAATPTVWRAAGAKIDPAYSLGRNLWDNWMVNFFMAEFGNFCFDLTPARVIFHPQHEDRVDQNWDAPKDDPILKRNNWPFHSITI